MERAVSIETRPRREERLVGKNNGIDPGEERRSESERDRPEGESERERDGERHAHDASES